MPIDTDVFEEEANAGRRMLTQHDALMLILEKAEALTNHVAERLLDNTTEENREIFELAIIAEAINAQHAEMRKQASVWLDACHAAVVKGGV